MRSKNKVALAAIFFLAIAFTRAEAELTYSVTDLGTLGGTTSSANGVAGQGQNAAGMIVGSSTASDNSPHAFLYVNGQMFDLNTLCDLSQTDFRVLTAAKSISDSCLIIGEGITNNGDNHAFLLAPLSVAGGQWSYACCQWVWIQDGGGWWWESNCGCYKWHGPPGHHPPCPPQPPPCWSWPLPCCPICPPPPPCWCCVYGPDGPIVVQLTPAECFKRGGKCYGSKEEAQAFKPCWWCCWRKNFPDHMGGCQKGCDGTHTGGSAGASKDCVPKGWHPQRKRASREVVSATVPKKKPKGIVPEISVGAASKDPTA